MTHQMSHTRQVLYNKPFGCRPLQYWLFSVMVLALSGLHACGQDAVEAGISDPAIVADLKLTTVPQQQPPATLLMVTEPAATSGPEQVSISSEGIATVAAMPTSADNAPSTALNKPRQRSQSQAARMTSRLRAQLRQDKLTADSSVGAMAMNPIYQTIFDKHNSYRAMHQAGPLTWDDNLATRAASYAGKCYFAHDPNANAGENLFAISDTNSASNALVMAIDNWYNEVSLYNFNSPGWNSAAGHFTQVVWKSTTSLGCAVATCSNGLRGQGFSWARGTLVVCRYSPAGNVIGQFATNVLRKTSSTPPATQPPAVPPTTPPPTSPVTPPPATQPPAQIPPGTLPAGYKFLSPGCLFSANARFRMCMQADGRVVLVDAGRVVVPGQQPQATVIWATSAAAIPRSPYKLTMQADGNLVASDVVGTVVWWTRAPNRGVAPYKMVVQDNGNVVVSDSQNLMVWQTNTVRA